MGMVPVILISSDCGGISTCMSVGFGGASELGSGDVHDGAGGGRGGSDGSSDGSGAGASGISSSLASIGFEMVASTSPISTSTVGGGVGSFDGVGSRVLLITLGSAVVSTVDDSSSGGDGGSGEGLLEDTSLRAGELTSIFTDDDRIRSRWSLSS